MAKGGLEWLLGQDFRELKPITFQQRPSGIIFYCSELYAIGLWHLEPDSPSRRLTQGQIAEAVVQWREAVRLLPRQIASLNQLAWTLATYADASVRNGAEAVELAEQAVQLSDGREPAILGTLAAAHAEAGQFAKAVEAAERALSLASARGDTALAESIQA